MVEGFKLEITKVYYKILLYKILIYLCLKKKQSSLTHLFKCSKTSA